MARLWGIREVKRRRVAAAVGSAVIALAGCGDSDGTTNAADPGSDLSIAAQEFGEAYLSGDSATLLNLIEPARSDRLQQEYRELVDSYGRPNGVVELKNFSFKITSENERGAEVSYSGQVCQPTLTNEFPETTLSGDADTEMSTRNTGSISVGAVRCAEVQDSAPLFWQIEFVKVDDHWYGKLPGT